MMLKAYQWLFFLFRRCQALIILVVFLLPYDVVQSWPLQIILLLVFISLGYDFFQWLTDPDYNKKAAAKDWQETRRLMGQDGKPRQSDEVGSGD